jgi:hypothetical protein
MGPRTVCRVATICLLVLFLPLTSVAHLGSATWSETDTGLEKGPRIVASDSGPTSIVGDKTRKSSSEGVDTSPRATSFDRTSLLRRPVSGSHLIGGSDVTILQTSIRSSLTTRAPPYHC